MLLKFERIKHFTRDKSILALAWLIIFGESDVKLVVV